MEVRERRRNGVECIPRFCLEEFGRMSQVRGCKMAYASMTNIPTVMVVRLQRQKWSTGHAVGLPARIGLPCSPRNKSPVNSRG